jgi:hypothetical protein
LTKGGVIIKTVFISHPYSNNPEGNFKKVDKLIRKLRTQYHDVLFISPLHLFSYFDKEEDGFRQPILNFCFSLIDECDEIWILGLSDGCIAERNYAKEVGTKIVWKV